MNHHRKEFALLSIFELSNSVARYQPRADLAPLRRSYELLRELLKERPQDERMESEAASSELALLVARLKLDVPSVAAALLVNRARQQPQVVERVRREVDPNSADVLAGVEAAAGLNLAQEDDRAAENRRKMVLSITKDLRAVLVRLCELLLSMRHLERMPEEEQAETALEVSQVYSPLANRLGIFWIKSELEDLTFKFFQRAEYESLNSSISGTRDEREQYIEKVQGILKETLGDAGLDVEVHGRSKHLYSVYRKMRRYGVGVENIHDLIAFRVLTDTREQCYQAIGMIHENWSHVPGRFKDYVSMPKPNGYQSLHTTVLGPNGKRMEVQVRTREMHRIAEDGVAAHWFYKEGGRGVKLKDMERFTWLRALLEGKENAPDLTDLRAEMQEGLFQNEVYVFTPQSSVVELPKGSTPIDFAYSVHTEVGNRCQGARVNDRIVPLRYQLQTGDVVEVLTGTTARPNRDWLKLVRTPRARSKIRQFLRIEEKEKALALGRELLEKELQRNELRLNRLLKQGELKRVAEELNYRTEEDLIAGVGFGKTSLPAVISRVLPPEEKEPLEELPAEEQEGEEEEKEVQGDGILVGGESGVLVRYAKCCGPLKGQPIVGFITRGHGITVHRENCPQVVSSPEDRRIGVTWDPRAEMSFPVKLKVMSDHRAGILADISKVFSEHSINILKVHGGPGSSFAAESVFEFQVESEAQLRKLLPALSRLQGVEQVERMTG